MTTTFDTVFGVALLLFILNLPLGWVLNVVDFASCDFKPSYKVEVLRGVGIVVPPLGCVLGWIPMEDGE